MEVKGKVLIVGVTESVGQNGFSKRLLVVETQEQYSQKIPIDFVKEKADLLNNITIGQEVTVSINLRGSEGNGKWFLNAQGWKIQ